jgi:two-component system, NarL family, nitrate/nitrite response regulator NarL
VAVQVTCLLVDDDARFLAIASRLLAREGLEIVGLASNGDEALRCAQNLRPDVALVDVDLSGESGFDVARELTALAGGAQPVIMISSYAEKDFHELVVSSSALGFVTKSELSARAIEELVRARDGNSALD